MLIHHHFFFCPSPTPTIFALSCCSRHNSGPWKIIFVLNPEPVTLLCFVSYQGRVRLQKELKLFSSSGFIILRLSLAFKCPRWRQSRSREMALKERSAIAGFERASLKGNWHVLDRGLAWIPPHQLPKYIDFVQLFSIVVFKLHCIWVHVLAFPTV